MGQILFDFTMQYWFLIVGALGLLGGACGHLKWKREAFERRTGAKFQASIERAAKKQEQERWERTMDDLGWNGTRDVVSHK